MKCALHNNEDAVAACTDCGLGVCDDCSSIEITNDEGEGEKVCPVCGLKRLWGRVLELSKQGDAKGLESYRNRRRFTFRIVSVWFLVAVVVGIITLFTSQQEPAVNAALVYCVVMSPLGLVYAFGRAMDFLQARTSPRHALYMPPGMSPIVYTMFDDVGGKGMIGVAVIDFLSKVCLTPLSILCAWKDYRHVQKRILAQKEAMSNADKYATYYGLQADIQEFKERFGVES